MKKTFENSIEKNLGTLNQYVPIVNRVHGPSHPEFNQVKETFDVINNKINKKDFNLTSEFDNLKTITSNYLVPNDVCESYEAVYNMLSDLDKSYREDL